jgi:hypothetical protein
VYVCTRGGVRAGRRSGGGDDGRALGASDASSSSSRGRVARASSNSRRRRRSRSALRAHNDSSASARALAREAMDGVRGAMARCGAFDDDASAKATTHGVRGARGTNGTTLEARRNAK